MGVPLIDQTPTRSTLPSISIRSTTVINRIRPLGLRKEKTRVQAGSGSRGI